MEKAGTVRDGGSFDDAHGRRGSCWNAVMDEDRYMVQKWNSVHRRVTPAIEEGEGRRARRRPPLSS